MLESLLLAFAWAPLGPAPYPAPQSISGSQDQAPGGASLQELLRLARERRQALFERLAPEVQSIVDKLEVLGRPQQAGELAKLHAQLDALGPEAGPLLLPYLEPGPTPSEPALFRAREIAAALRRNTPRAITEGLIQLTNTASVDGRVNAISVLGTSPERERASAVLRELFRVATGKLRIASIEALASHGGAEHLELITSALASGDPAVRQAVLRALAAAQCSASAPAVLALVRERAGAVLVLHDLVGYYLACPAVIDEPTQEALGDLLLDEAAPAPARVALLDALSRTVRELAPELRRKLDGVLASSNVELREAGLILLAVLGDRTARRELVEGYDELVDSNPRYGPVYEQRADVLLRLGEFADAARDFKQSIEILERDSRFVSKELWIKLARAYARDGKDKQAYETLRAAQLSPSLLQKLRDDPDFAALAAHTRYAKLFE